MKNSIFDNNLFIKTCKWKLEEIESKRSKDLKKNVHYQSICNFYYGLSKYDTQEERSLMYKKLLLQYLDIISEESDEVLESNSRLNYSTYVEPIGLYLAEKEYYALYTYLLYFFIGITVGLILTTFFKNYIWVVIGTIMTLWARHIYISKKRRQNKLYGFQF